MKKITITLELSDEEIQLLKTTDWTKEVDWDEKYNSLILKGVLCENYAMNLFITYGFTQLGGKLIDQING